jgi:hypothetical protein
VRPVGGAVGILNREWLGAVVAGHGVLLERLD